jgi:non-heme chloroperoxidase
MKPRGVLLAQLTNFKEKIYMSTITVKDGTTFYYKDWGKGPVVTFSHGWPLSSDAWDGQMLFLAQNGFRAVAHDRRGHGRSSQAWSGNDMNGYADDLAAVIEALDLKDVTLVGHSTGGRRSDTVHRTPWYKASFRGRSDWGCAADPGEVRFQPGRDSH